MRFVVVIHSQQKGFLVALGKLLSRKHEVGFLAGDSDVAAIIRRHIPDAKIMIEGEGGAKSHADPAARARQLEEKYSVRMSMLLSHDRALGRGYLFNVDRYPAIGKSWWPQQRKLSAMISRFEDAEALYDRFRPDCVISLQKDQVRYIVAEHRGIAAYSPAPVKIGERFIWSDDTYLTSKEFLAAIRGNLGKPVEELHEIGEYAQEAGSKLNHSMVRYSWGRALTDVRRQVMLETYKLARGFRRKDSYAFMGWVPSILRRPLMYDYFVRHGVRPGELEGRRICYIPMHLEPEIALLSISPEFNNSMEMIAWISKAVPADVTLLIKEQPFSFGVRSKRYYDQLRQIGNVELAHPEVTSWQSIDAAIITATITGTAGTESVIFKKPVLSFGAHQAINLLPSVRFCDNYESTRTGVDELLSMDAGSPDFEHARRALYSAQLDTSFELQGFSRTYKSAEPQDDMAAAALKALAGRLEGFSWTDASG